MDIIAMELLKAFGRLWLHPLTYVFILTALWFGIRRVKRERKDFHTRVHDVIHELTFPLLISVVFAIILSVIVAVAGIELPIGMIALMAILWLLLLPFRKARLLSMTFVGTIVLFVALFLPEIQTNYLVINGLISDIQSVNVVGFAALLVVLFVAESLLILFNGWKKTSPKLIVSKRGKTVGSHEANRLWFIPLLVLLPAGPLSFEGGWWPLLESGSAGVGFMFVPFILGFQLTVQSSLPKEKIRQAGKRMLALSILLGLILAGAWFYTPAVIALAAIALIGREVIYYLHNSMEKRSTNFYTNRGTGLTVVGVLPFSTGEKLGITVGETIQRVNGWEVFTQHQLYEALQMNPAYCKLEVLDIEGEVRFVQSSVYEGDHYQIGLLFVPDENMSSNLSERGLRSSAVIHKDRNGEANGKSVEDVSEEKVVDLIEGNDKDTEVAFPEPIDGVVEKGTTEESVKTELVDLTASIDEFEEMEEEPMQEGDPPYEKERIEELPVEQNVTEKEEHSISGTFDIAAIRKEYLELREKEEKIYPIYYSF
ncbi:MAG: S1C family serine protease [Bacillus sp. (in: Bacteria)]|nr:S1C family serine protease [Bacillus sp. (in: firmicutes)]